MTIEEKEKLLTQSVKLKLDSINYQITAINSYFVKDCLLRDGTCKHAIITGFHEPMLDSKSSVISDPETLEMLYVWTGPMNFIDIDDFFKL